MTDIRTNIYWKLTDAAAVYAIVGDRVYPTKLPEGATIPAITYQIIDDPPAGQAFNEPSTTPYPRIQLKCWDTTEDGAVALGAATKAALDGQAGWWEGTGGRVRVWESIYIGGAPMPDPEARLFYSRLDFHIMHST